MRKLQISLVVASVCFTVACSPRDFLTRRLAADLIAGSDTFKTPQQFWLRTGIISSKDYSSPEYLVLQKRGWITGASVPCTPNLGGTHTAGGAAQSCWDVALTPLGIEAFRGLIPNNAAPSQYFSVPVARRELIGITGVSKEGNFADIEFQWKWVPMNEIGAALYVGGVQYNSSVGFRHYDDDHRGI